MYFLRVRQSVAEAGHRRRGAKRVLTQLQARAQPAQAQLCTHWRAHLTEAQQWRIGSYLQRSCKVCLQ